MSNESDTKNMDFLANLKKNLGLIQQIRNIYHLLRNI